MAISFLETVPMQIGDETVDIIERGGRQFVMIPLEDYPGMRETAHLLSTQENATDLRDSIEWLNKAARGADMDMPEGYESVQQEYVYRGVTPKVTRIYTTILEMAYAARANGKLSEDDFEQLVYDASQKLNPGLKDVPSTSQESAWAELDAVALSVKGEPAEQARTLVEVIQSVQI
jgi:PHD/YefM family antitoxin component YafN of YafNO toxin-antitoxin module